MWHTVNNSTVTGGGKGVVILWRNGAEQGRMGNEIAASVASSQ